MFYRVLQYRKNNKNMSVIDSDENLEELKKRNEIEDCSKHATKFFNNHKLQEKQTVFCVNNGNKTTYIIKEN